MIIIVNKDNDKNVLEYVTRDIKDKIILTDEDWNKDVSNNDNNLVIFTNDVITIKKLYEKYNHYRKFLVIDDKIKLYLNDLLMPNLYLIPIDIQTYINIYNSKKIFNPLTLPLNLSDIRINGKTYLGKEILNDFSHVRTSDLLNYKFDVTMKIQNTHSWIYKDLNTLKDITKHVDLNMLKNSYIIKFKKDEIYCDLNKLRNYYSIRNNIINCRLSACMGYARGYRGFMKNFKILELKNYSYHELSKSVRLKRGINYIWVREGTVIHDYKKILRDYYIEVAFKRHTTMSFLMNSSNDKEMVLLTRTNKRDKLRSYNDIINNINYMSDKVVGHNSRKLDDFNALKLHWLYGKCRLWSYFFPLNKLHLDYFTIAVNKGLLKKNDINRQFCKVLDTDIKIDYNKFKRIIAFQLGLEGTEMGNIGNKILTFARKNRDYFKTKKILLVTKIISGYGGNQKTARQIYDNLSKYYRIKILSLAPARRDKFDFRTDMRCDNDIHNLDIVKIKRYGAIVEHINNGNYIRVLNNKWNELKNINHLLKNKVDYITHNHNDPFNLSIIKSSNYINRIFTINDIHKEIFMRRGVKNNIKKFINHIDDIKYFKHDNTEFKYNIVFIGRLSKEKNVDILLEAFKKIQTIIPKLNLYILGDGKNEYYKNYKNVHYFGKVDFEKVLTILLKCDYSILTSISEGVPFTILESMSMGIPVLSTNINGVNEYVENDKTGFLCDIVDYNKKKYDLGSWDILDIIDLNRERNIKNVAHMIAKGYSIKLNSWHEMSKNCYEFIKKHFKKNADKENLKNIVE